MNNDELRPETVAGVGDKQIQILRDLLQTMCDALVDKPDGLTISCYQWGGIPERNFVFVISVAKEEKGKLIGKKGQTIESIRTILRGAGKRSETRVSVAFEGEPIRE